MAVDVVNAWTQLYNEILKDIEKYPAMKFSEQTAMLVIMVGQKIKKLESRHSEVVRTRVHGKHDA